MKELYDCTLKEVIDDIVADVAEEQEISKKLARTLVINTLLYNVVTESVKEQVAYLLDRE